MIREIPSSFSLALEQAKDVGVPRGEKMVFTGNGTAFFSAWLGSQVLAGSGVPHEVVQAYEMEHYRAGEKNEVVVGVSHSGITKSTLDALKKAKQSGSFVIGVTHFSGRTIEGVCDVTLVVGNGPDKSRCHTKTYLDSAGAVARLGFAIARRLRKEVEGEKPLGELGPKLLEVVRSSEGPAQKLVGELPEISNVVFAGAGPNQVTAREAALKIKESSFIPSEGIELEEEGHGSWVNLNPSTLFAVIAPRGPSVGRAQDMLKAASKVGAKTLAISDSDLGADYNLRTPEVPEILSPFLTITPLYFVAYFLSVRRGNNPDYLRYLTPAYWEGRQFVFPPGTH